MKKELKKWGLPIAMVLAFSVVFKDVLLGILFGFVFYLAQDKKDCCK